MKKDMVIFHGNIDEGEYENLPDKGKKNMMSHCVKENIDKDEYY